MRGKRERDAWPTLHILWTGCGDVSRDRTPGPAECAQPTRGSGLRGVVYTAEVRIHLRQPFILSNLFVCAVYLLALRFGRLGFIVTLEPDFLRWTYGVLESNPTVTARERPRRSPHPAPTENAHPNVNSQTALANA